MGACRWFGVGVVVFAVILGCVKLVIQAPCPLEIQDLTGKTFIVTGGTAGIGKETSKVFVEWGGRVIMGCRNATKAEAVVREIEEVTGTVGQGRVESWDLDLASLDSVRAFADRYISSGLPLHALVNNAGIVSKEYIVTPDGFESDLQVNHLGHFLLTNLLLERLVSTASETGDPARVVHVSSQGAYLGHLHLNDGTNNDFVEPMGTNGFPTIHGPDDHWFQRYGNSKLMNIVFSGELHRRAAAAHLPLISNSLHPGMIFTDIVKDYPAFVKALLPLADVLFLRGVEDGSKTQIKLATDPELATVSGRYFEDCAAVEPTTMMAFNAQTAAPPAGSVTTEGAAAATATATAAVEALGRRLWEVSAEMVGLGGGGGGEQQML